MNEIKLGMLQDDVLHNEIEAVEIDNIESEVDSHFEGLEEKISDAITEYKESLMEELNYFKADMIDTELLEEIEPDEPALNRAAILILLELVALTDTHLDNINIGNAKTSLDTLRNALLEVL